MPIIDTHCHLYEEYYSNIDDIIIKSKQANVTKVINSGIDDKSNREALSLSKRRDDVYCSLGIHPEYSKSYEEKDIDFIRENICDNKVVAVGEIGLDYHYDDFDKESQSVLFEKQLRIAEENNIPVVVHSRQATQDTIDILKKFSVKGVIHCFSGSYETAMEYIKIGFLLGVNGVVTFKNSKLIEVLKKTGINNWVLETDSPFLSPSPYRGTTNSPANTVLIAQFIATNLEISIEDVINITTKNAMRVFDKLNR